MSRWQYGDWALAAVVMEDNGNIFPLSELESRYGLRVKGYYEESFLLGPTYYRMDDITGAMGAKYEGSFTIGAHLQITDASGRVNTLYAECDGYTCCGTDCFMLLIINASKNAASVTLDFQEVDELEIKEAVGRKRFENWVNENHGESTLVILENPPFQA